MDELDAEIMRVKIEKMRQLMADLEKREQMKKEEDPEVKKDKIFMMILTPAAQSYYSNLKKSDPKIARELRDGILNLLIRGFIQRMIDEIDLEIVVRRMRGEEPQVYIKRKGEDAVPISEFFKRKE